MCVARVHREVGVAAVDVATLQRTPAAASNDDKEWRASWSPRSLRSSFAFAYGLRSAHRHAPRRRPLKAPGTRHRNDTTVRYPCRMAAGIHGGSIQPIGALLRHEPRLDSTACLIRASGAGRASLIACHGTSMREPSSFGDNSQARPHGRLARGYSSGTSGRLSFLSASSATPRWMTLWATSIS
jgi:hypothetical protein